MRWRSGAPPGTIAALGDLARGGVFVRTTTPLDRGELVSGSFLLPRRSGPLLVAFRGEVAWRSAASAPSMLGPGIGVRFTRVVTTSMPPHSVALRVGAAPRARPVGRRTAVERLVAACRTPHPRVTIRG